MSILKKCVLAVVLMLLVVPVCSSSSVVKTKPVVAVSGHIINATCDAGFEYYTWWNSTLMVPVLSYRVIGIGNYDIVFTMILNLSFYNNTWRNASYTFRDSLFWLTWHPFLYLGMFSQGYLPFKMIAKQRFMFPEDKIRAGFWSIRVTISNSNYSMVLSDVYYMNQ